MGLKAVVKNLEDDVPEALRGLYVKSGDDYVLEIDERDFKARIQEFRTSNLELKRETEQLTEQLKKFEGVDPDEYQELVQFKEAAGEFEAEKTQLTERIQELEAAAGKAKGSFSKLKMEQEVRKAFAAAGLKVKPGASQDIISRAKEVWKLNDADELDTDLINEKETAKLTLQEWGQQLAKEAPYFFESPPEPKKVPAQAGPKSIHSGDAIAFGQHLEEIARGKVQVTGVGGKDS